MKFKKVLALGLVGAMTLSLAACGNSSSGSNNAGTGSSDETNASGETISLVLWGAEEDQTLLTELVEKFEATYSDHQRAMKKILPKKPPILSGVSPFLRSKFLQAIL